MLWLVAEKGARLLSTLSAAALHHGHLCSGARRWKLLDCLGVTCRKAAAGPRVCPQ